jgi:hypothetical protein
MNLKLSTYLRMIRPCAEYKEYYKEDIKYKEDCPLTDDRNVIFARQALRKKAFYGAV